MSRAWVFQANPKWYDIDRAISTLDRLWWRCPQYTADVRVGDAVVMWRSGDDAGVVGVGQVIEPPQLRDPDPAEDDVVLAETEFGSTTRVRIDVFAVPFISKDQIRLVPELMHHRIVTAPMGTVFPLDPEEWGALCARFPEVTVGVAHHVEVPAVAPVFGWDQRVKGVTPMPGGYDGYLASVRRMCQIVDEARPTSPEFVDRIQSEFGLQEKGARARESFLRRIGLFVVEVGTLQLSAEARHWVDSGSDELLVALLHSRVQFVGEMLHELQTPMTTDELLGVVNTKYRFGWDTKTQLDNRRGWLQSSGMLHADADRRLFTTQAGLQLLERLVLHVPNRAMKDTFADH